MIILLLILQLVNPTYAANFNTCALGTDRTKTSNFCPRVEGAYPRDCCPMIVKNPALSCDYYISASQIHSRPSSHVKCVNGVNVTEACCSSYSVGCQADRRTVPFKQRLIRDKSGQCCFENCPPAQYWRENIFKPSPLTPQHQYVGGNSDRSCNEPPINTCPSGLPDCDNNPCPPPPPVPQPPQPPYPNPQPQPPSPPQPPQPEPPLPQPPPIIPPDPPPSKIRGS